MDLSGGFQFLLPSTTTPPPSIPIMPADVPPPGSTCYCGPTEDYLYWDKVENVLLYFGGMLTLTVYTWLSSIAINYLISIDKPWADLLAMAIAKSCNQPLPARKTNASAEATDEYVSGGEFIKHNTNTHSFQGVGVEVVL